ncbi:sensor histidine kinase [Wenjunlia tyrosinilytica]|uniref:histidine kinase n=1 Tax=Wenjunlia tyrosinilytica TaxID=1544741 RepID=A0A917ZGU2_9ACTN|nr:histidine kinase [Wenjunlia tyrosinilytica]GGO82463.1 two-component sensor histidine kinase [Wenjunlia tyrosinilytica]
MEDPVSLPRFVRAAARWTLLLFLGLLWLFDINGSPLYGTTPVLTGALFAAVVLIPGRLPLRWRAGIVGAASWAVTFAVVPGDSWARFSTWGMLETAVLLWVLMLTVRRVQPPQLAMAEGALLSTAVIVMPLRIIAGTEALTFSFLLTFVVAAAIGLALYLRVLDARRIRAVDAVRQSERLELARDLHDFVAHHVTGIVVQAQAARTVGATSPQEVEPLLASIEQAGAEALASMRRLVQVLREDERTVARPAEGFTELTALTTEFSRTGPYVSLRVAEAARGARLAPEVTTSAHRVVQEALTNVRRHAPSAASVLVRIGLVAGCLEVTVCNDAPAHGGHRGAPTGGHGGFGLVGLRERVEAVGGNLRAGPLPQGGWEVAARLPVLSMTGS